ncbi:MAG: hypothetical protein QF893_13880 [Alphaproteobacteria bacterium]|jgi:hypothetical protein|nr:hypothetical protein [Alphaproteobacteria bacterium]
MTLPLSALSRALAVSILSMLVVAGAQAGEADVVAVKVTKNGERIYRFDVTVRHGDKGWEHYANKWDVVAPDGKVLGTRELLHPHDHEQPFTRSLSGVRVPAGIGAVTIRAHDLVHKYGGKERQVDLPQ